MRVKAIRISRTGGLEVMEYVDVQVGDPGLGEIRIQHAACGLNFIDVYFRIGGFIRNRCLADWDKKRLM